jgi:hypothetical protein
MSNSQKFQPSDFLNGALKDMQLVNLARIAGIALDDDDMPPELQEFTLLIMETCAGVGDKYSNPESGQTAGDEIRALFGLV